MSGSDFAASGMGVQGLGAASSKQAEMVQFKVQMDGLKKRLANPPDQEEELRKACRDFEAVFIGKLWEQMEKTVSKEGYLHSKQEDMYKSMFGKEFSESMADAGGIGLADMLYDQLAQKLKQASTETLAANSKIKPLSENGKPEISTLDAVRNDLTSLQRDEPAAPVEIVPEGMGPTGTDAQVQGGYELEKKAAEALDPERQPSAAAGLNVSGLTRSEVEAELNQLARDLRGEQVAKGPGAAFDSAKKGPFLSSADDGGATGRKLAEI